MASVPPPIIAELAEAGSLLAAAESEGRGAGAPCGLPLRDVRFAHAVNSAAALAAALADRAVTVLEGDVIVAASGAAVMGHNPGQPHDLTLVEFARAALAAGRGIKADVKQHAATAAVLAAVAVLDTEVHRGGLPAWPLLRVERAGARSAGEYVTRPAVLINADVLAGTAACRFFDAPGAPPLTRAQELAAAGRFVEAVGDALPSGHVLSLGWATQGEHGAYSAGMVDDMLAVAGLAASVGAPITFACRGSYVVASWPQLQRLLAAGPCTSLTVWSNTPLAPLEEGWLRAHLPRDRVMYDLPRASAVQGGASAQQQQPPGGALATAAEWLRSPQSAAVIAAVAAVAVGAATLLLRARR